MKTVREFCSPQNDRPNRYAGLWAYQVAIDTIAFAQNVPLRIVLLDKLRDLPAQIQHLAQSEDGQKLLAEINFSEDEKKEFDKGRFKLWDPSLFFQYAQWVVSCGSGDGSPVGNKPDAWWFRAMLQLLPHIERRIWLTEMGNPHPAHAVARMLDHWSLYVLMWSYLNLRHRDSREAVHTALDIFGTYLMLGEPFELAGASDQDDAHHCQMVVGPFFPEGSDQGGRETALERRFFDYLRDIKQKLPDLPQEDLANKTPSRQELRDALKARFTMPEPEAQLRRDSAQTAFDAFLNAKLDAHVQKPEGMGRSDWEQLAMLCSWHARWSRTLKRAWKYGVQARRGLWVSDGGGVDGSAGKGLLIEPEGDAWSWLYCVNKPEGVQTVAQWNAAGPIQKQQWMLDDPAVYWNRAKERQNASWTQQIIAINNLLQNHAAGALGQAAAYGDSLDRGTQFEEASHLLRGYAGRICHHLLSLSRADVADIYWYDYAQNPPRLVHVGGYLRLLKHRVNRQDIHQDFDTWARKKSGPGSLSPADWHANPQDTPSQAYRVAMRGQEDLSAQAYFDNFPQNTRPRSAMAFPILVHQRVVGVLTLAGLNHGQFADRLAAPLHRVANLLGQTLYQASLLWQMRQITDFFTRTPHDRFHPQAKNHFNPLRTVSACLTNVFLCRGVRIWLALLASPRRHRLYGCNLQLNDQDDAETLILPASSQSSKSETDDVVPLDTPFLAFLRPELGVEQAHGWVQGRYKPAADMHTKYTRAAARQGMTLGDDFVNESPLRQRIFKEQHLHDLAAFALLQELAGQPKPKWVGAITLHDTHAPRDGETMGAEIQPWPLAWQAVVAHVQTYLPNLLAQVELTSRPLDEMRRFLLHEGRAELLKLRSLVHALQRNTRQVLAPDAALRQLLRQLAAADPEVLGQALVAEHIDKQAGQAWAAVHSLNSSQQTDNLDFLIRAIDRHREFSNLNIEMAAGSTYVNVEDSLREALKPFERAFKQRGIDPLLRGFDRSVRLWVRPIWWDRVLSNLVDNAQKYAWQRFEVHWLAHERVLRFLNLAPYDKEQDDPQALLTWGYRGSAASHSPGRVRRTREDQPSGQGHGLWGTQLLCELEGLALELHASPQANPLAWEGGKKIEAALYTFDIRIPAGRLKA